MAFSVERIAYSKNKKNFYSSLSAIRYPLSAKKGFTLLEVLVAVTVFGLIVAAAAGTFASIQRSWRKQRNTIDMVQNARWALERIANELRNGANTSTPGGGNRVRFELSPGGPANRVWYWRGNTVSDTTGLGNSNFLYRGPGNNINIAYNNRQQLANFIVDNPTGSDIFIDTGGELLTIELTVRPNPDQPAGPNNRDYTLRTQVRVRN